MPSALVTELFADDGRLAKGNSAVIGGDIALGEDLEAVVAESPEAARKQERVLEAATAEADAVELEIRTHAPADRGDDGDERVVKAGCHEGLRAVGFDVSDDLANHGAQVDFDWRGAGEDEVTGICG